MGHNIGISGTCRGRGKGGSRMLPSIFFGLERFERKNRRSKVSVPPKVYSQPTIFVRGRDVLFTDLVLQFRCSPLLFGDSAFRGVFVFYSAAEVRFFLPSCIKR